jgi:hypothetical protein
MAKRKTTGKRNKKSKTKGDTQIKINKKTKNKIFFFAISHPNLIADFFENFSISYS